MKRIYIVDDHAVMRQSYALLLQRHGALELCGEAASAEEALTQMSCVQPDLVLIDMSLPKMNGLELLGILRKQMPQLYVLMVSGHRDNVFIDGILAQGAHGYLPKELAPKQLIAAIEQILSGHIYRCDE
jgi:DNA-binding NarL/FixJ family response regulator